MYDYGNPVFTVPSWNSIRAPGPGDLGARTLILADGDSWFHLCSWTGYTMLHALAAKMHHVAIVSHALLGKDAYRLALKGCTLCDSLRDPELRFHAILLSTGGTDFLEKVPYLPRPIEHRRNMDPSDPKTYYFESRMSGILRGIESALRRVAELRAQGHSHAAPIFVHTYDYFTPRHTPVGAGPWVHPVMEKHRIPESMRMPIVRSWIDAVANALIGAARVVPNLHILETRGTLEPAQPDQGMFTKHWVNEIHPNQRGCLRLAERIAPQIHERVKDR